jgi:glycosyltransferase involved in cell wall biosynthesis
VNGELVSVVIPTFNRAGLIARAIDSALAQTHPALEVIVVDDGSTDGTAELVRRRYAAELRVRCLTQTNQGVCAARNRGLAEARGDYVALLDSDDVWRPWKLELQLSCLRAVPEAGMVWTDMEAIGPDGNILSRKYLRTMYRNSYRWFPKASNLFSSSRPLADICSETIAPVSTARLYWGDIYSPMIMGNLVHTSTVLLRRERLARVGRFNESLKISGEDYDFHLRTCREGPVALADVSSIQYQVGRTDQLSHSAYAIHMARNFLATITPALERDRERIRLPANMLAAVRAFAHGWIGIELFELGDNVEALRYMGQSLHLRAWQPKIWVFYVLSLLPPRTSGVAMRFLRGIRDTLRALARR